MLALAGLLKYYSPFGTKIRQITALTFFAITKTITKMGLLSLSNLEICIKKAEFSDFKGLKVN